jgi:hypothetical protein
MLEGCRRHVRREGVAADAWPTEGSGEPTGGSDTSDGGDEEEPALSLW